MVAQLAMSWRGSEYSSPLCCGRDFYRALKMAVQDEDAKTDCRAQRPDEAESGARWWEILVMDVQEIARAAGNAGTTARTSTCGNHARPLGPCTLRICVCMQSLSRTRVRDLTRTLGESLPTAAPHFLASVLLCTSSCTSSACPCMDRYRRLPGTTRDSCEPISEWC